MPSTTIAAVERTAAQWRDATQAWERYAAHLETIIDRAALGAATLPAVRTLQADLASIDSPQDGWTEFDGVDPRTHPPANRWLLIRVDRDRRVTRAVYIGGWWFRPIDGPSFSAVDRSVIEWRLA